MLFLFLSTYVNYVTMLPYNDFYYARAEERLRKYVTSKMKNSIPHPKLFLKAVKYGLR